MTLACPLCLAHFPDRAALIAHDITRHGGMAWVGGTGEWRDGMLLPAIGLPGVL